MYLQRLLRTLQVIPQSPKQQPSTMPYLSNNKPEDFDKYFKESEFNIDGVTVYDKMDPLMIYLLVQLRKNTGLPIVPTSTDRSPEKNKAVGGSKYSRHLKGQAVDFICDNSSDRAIFVREALLLGLTVGVMKTALHVDMRAYDNSKRKLNPDKVILFHYYGRY